METSFKFDTACIQLQQALTDPEIFKDAYLKKVDESGDVVKKTGFERFWAGIAQYLHLSPVRAEQTLMRDLIARVEIAGGPQLQPQVDRLRKDVYDIIKSRASRKVGPTYRAEIIRTALRKWFNGVLVHGGFFSLAAEDKEKLIALKERLATTNTQGEALALLSEVNKRVTEIHKGYMSNSELAARPDYTELAKEVDTLAHEVLGLATQRALTLCHQLHIDFRKGLTEIVPSHTTTRSDAMLDQEGQFLNTFQQRFNEVKAQVETAIRDLQLPPEVKKDLKLSLDDLQAKITAERAVIRANRQCNSLCDNLSDVKDLHADHIRKRITAASHFEEAPLFIQVQLAPVNNAAAMSQELEKQIDVSHQELTSRWDNEVHGVEEEASAHPDTLTPREVQALMGRLHTIQKRVAQHRTDFHARRGTTYDAFQRRTTEVMQRLATLFTQSTQRAFTDLPKRFEAIKIYIPAKSLQEAQQAADKLNDLDSDIRHLQQHIQNASRRLTTDQSSNSRTMLPPLEDMLEALKPLHKMRQLEVTVYTMERNVNESEKHFVSNDRARKDFRKQVLATVKQLTRDEKILREAGFPYDNISAKLQGILFSVEILNQSTQDTPDAVEMLLFLQLIHTYIGIPEVREGVILGEGEETRSMISKNESAQIEGPVGLYAQQKRDNSKIKRKGHIKEPRNE